MINSYDKGDRKLELNPIQGSWIAFGRILLGLFWIYEVLLGHNWKLFNPKWMGDSAGRFIIEAWEQAIVDGGWFWFTEIWNTFIIPYSSFWSYAIIFLQLSLGILLITGLFVRPAMIFALALDFSIFMLGNSRIPPFFAIGHLLALVTNAGMYYGLDSLLRNYLEKLRSGISLLFARLTYPVMVITALLAVYYFLKIPVLETSRYRMVGLDLAFIFGLISASIFFFREGVQKMTIIVRGLQIFIGYKFLHEIWVRSVPALNGLPGWASVRELGELFSQISANHITFVATIIDNIFTPFVGFWVIIFAVIQTFVGIMLISNWRSRLASQVGIFYLALLILLGFTRYTPFILMFLILSYGLKNEIRLPKYCLPVFVIAFLLFVVGALSFGITAGEYKENMGGVVMAMTAMYSLVFSAVSVFQLSAKLFNED